MVGGRRRCGSVGQCAGRPLSLWVIRMQPLLILYFKPFAIIILLLMVPTFFIQILVKTSRGPKLKMILSRNVLPRLAMA